MKNLSATDTLISGGCLTFDGKATIGEEDESQHVDLGMRRHHPPLGVTSSHETMNTGCLPSHDCWQLRMVFGASSTRFGASRSMSSIATTSLRSTNPAS
jgi:hypothetical protein